MTNLDRVIVTPTLLEIDEIEIEISPAKAWELVRHGDLAVSPLVRALFAARTAFGRTEPRPTGELTLRLDELVSTPSRPGFSVLVDEPEHEVVVGAIGKVWHLVIPFVHVADLDAFRRFSEAGFVKVALALRVLPRGEHGSRVELELRVDATDAAAWAKFRRYFTVIGPASRFIRRALLSALAREYGIPESSEEHLTLAGDELLTDAGGQITHSVTVGASPHAIWPWLVPTTPDGNEGFEVLSIEPGRALVLGALYDADAKRLRPFAGQRPDHFWHVTWSFVLEPLGESSTRLYVRARAAFPGNGGVHIEWIKPVHHLMQKTQLHHLAARVEHRQTRDDTRDLAEGIAGAAVMVVSFLTPFLRGKRSHWGVDAAIAQRELPGDALVTNARWGWTHGIEIDAPARAVWPWIAQLGADRGGFYSYQWLENVVGSELQNAESIHPEWALAEGDAFVLHPKIPPLRVVSLEDGRFFVVHAPRGGDAHWPGRPWAEASWLFLVEPLGEDRSRLISRYRCATSDELASRISLGPTLLEPIGFAMDRRMLLGVKARAEDRMARRPLRSFARRGAGSTISKKEVMR